MAANTSSIDIFCDGNVMKHFPKAAVTDEFPHYESVM